MIRRWTKWIPLISVAATTIPLFLLGLILIKMSAPNINKAVELTKENILSNTQTDLEIQISYQKNLSRALAQSTPLNPDAKNIQDQLNQWIDAYPNLLSVKYYPSNSSSILSSVRMKGFTSNLRPEEVQNFRSEVISREVFIGKIKSTPTGRVSIPIYTLSAGKNFYCFEFDGTSWGVVLNRIVSPVVIKQNGEPIISNNAYNDAAKNNTLANMKPFMNSISINGITIEGFIETKVFYKPIKRLAVQFLTAISLIGLISGFLSWFLAMRSQSSIAHEERLATLGRLSSSVGHELRTGLIVIRNSLSIIEAKSDKVDPLVNKHLDFIKQQIGTSQRILSNLLDFSKKQKFSVARVPINETIQSMIDQLPKPENCQILTSFENETLHADLDVDEFKMALANIFTNSFQAMENGGTLKVKTLSIDKNIRVIIEDSGAGFDPSLQNKITRPFFTTKVQGTGLGLAMVKKFTERHSGQLTISSKPGIGTVVELSLVGAA